jgi:hypothetical protein
MSQILLCEVLNAKSRCFTSTCLSTRTLLLLSPTTVFDVDGHPLVSLFKISNDHPQSPAPLPCLFHQYMSVCQHHYAEYSWLCVKLMVRHFCSCPRISKPFVKPQNHLHTCERIWHLHHTQAQSDCGHTRYVFYTSAHLFLAQWPSKLAIFWLILHWCSISCTAVDSWHFVMETCTNIDKGTAYHNLLLHRNKTGKLEFHSPSFWWNVQQCMFMSFRVHYLNNPDNGHKKWPKYVTVMQQLDNKKESVVKTASLHVHWSHNTTVK